MSDRGDAWLPPKRLEFLKSGAALPHSTMVKELHCGLAFSLETAPLLARRACLVATRAGLRHDG
jgi:hypothetical protein